MYITPSNASNLHEIKEKKKKEREDKVSRYILGGATAFGLGALAINGFRKAPKPKPTILNTITNGIKNVFNTSKSNPFFTLSLLLGFGAANYYKQTSSPTPPLPPAVRQSILNKMSSWLSKPLEWIKNR